MKKFLSKNYLPLITLLLFLIIPATASALKLQVDYPRVAGIDLNNVDFDNPAFFADFLKYIYYFFLSIGGIATFIMLVWGGFRWLTSAGNPAGIGEAKDIIFSALLGLVLLVGSYLILSTINPSLVIIEIPGLSTTPSGSGDENGVYLCDGDNCNAAWRRTTTNIDSICDDPVPYQDSSTPGSDDRICRQIGSIKIIGDYAVRLYENKDYGGRNICFNSSVDTLDNYAIVRHNGWNQDTDSVEILPKDGCKSPGFTIPAGDKGVYLCDDDGCLAGRRFTMSSIENICYNTGESDLICGQIGSLAINGDYNVRLFENNNFGGKYICFTQSIYTLDCYDIGGSGWNMDTDSVEILPPGGCEPQDAGVTYTQDGDVFSNGPNSSADCQNKLNQGLIEAPKTTP